MYCRLLQSSELHCIAGDGGGREMAMVGRDGLLDVDSRGVRLFALCVVRFDQLCGHSGYVAAMVDKGSGGEKPGRWTIKHEEYLGEVANDPKDEEQAAHDVARDNETHRLDAVLGQVLPGVRAVQAILVVGDVAEDRREEDVDGQDGRQPGVRYRLRVVGDAAAVRLDGDGHDGYAEKHEAHLQHEHQRADHGHPSPAKKRQVCLVQQNEAVGNGGEAEGDHAVPYHLPARHGGQQAAQDDDDEHARAEERGEHAAPRRQHSRPLQRDADDDAQVVHEQERQHGKEQNLPLEAGRPGLELMPGQMLLGRATHIVEAGE
ncbi:hypothetical protein SYNPS1DRAFT_27570 [Syncephalis pseudoplumigaleata]|uniref:Uncharacterized protein n=1 Tax=Syncephalis pseudoplumigaleata TaxID=1712513 RepID=A0A4P9Z2M1_9FUNG|nr:hypothetical protein SYNPS1DRAFT_27570 [Syncephalis pseudoplumigaleata]|eukprot:RKP26744.1 hypothetical protein SYNPS1DRAFT_27570 [Syncephalis pseudoplumigaleata]